MNPNDTDALPPLPLTEEAIARIRFYARQKHTAWPPETILRLCDAAEALAARDAEIADLRLQLGPTPAQDALAVDRMKRKNLELQAEIAELRARLGRAEAAAKESAKC